jgi:uncharacterized protein
MNNKRTTQLRFNFGFLLETHFGATRDIELDYPSIQVTEDLLLEPLQGVFQASRTTRGIYVSGMLQTNIDIECGRCLEQSAIPTPIELDELFYYPPNTAPPGEPVVGEDGFIDLGPIVRDLVLLEVPLHPLCRPDCRGLCPECGENLNDAGCECEQGEVDDRLRLLRDALDE